MFGRNSRKGGSAAQRAATVHLVNPMTNAWGGSENRTIQLYKLLSQYAETRVWSEHRVDPHLASRLPIHRIRPFLRRYPRGGNLVFVGCYFRIGPWLRHAAPERVIGLYNTQDAANLDQFMAILRGSGADTRCEMVYAAQWLQRRTGLPGVVHVSPIDLNVFVRLPQRPVSAARPFTIGRMSRDVADKHHPDDADLYAWHAQAGGIVKVMGGLVLHERLKPHANIHVSAAGSEPAMDFLHALDCFFYRTDRSFFEPFGRVVVEAMACGLPVVCGAQGGYREFIEDGRNGFLFESNEEARQIIARLKADPALRLAVGAAARQTVEDMYSERQMAEMAHFYVKPALAELR